MVKTRRTGVQASNKQLLEKSNIEVKENNKEIKKKRVGKKKGQLKRQFQKEYLPKRVECWRIGSSQIRCPFKLWYFQHCRHYKYGKNYVARSQQQKQQICPICVCSLISPEKESLVTELLCNHKFHKTCIEKWIKDNNRCPMCKRDYQKNQQFKRIIEDQKDKILFDKVKFMYYKSHQNDNFKYFFQLYFGCNGSHLSKQSKSTNVVQLRGQTNDERGDNQAQSQQGSMEEDQ